MTHLTQAVARLLRGRQGSSAVEFALVLPILIATLTAVVDLGMGFYEQMQVRNAAQAGASYATLHGFQATAIQNAVTSAVPLPGVTALPAPTQSCGCATGTGIGAAACNSTCPNGQTAGTYVSVSAQVTFRPFLPYPFLGSPLVLTGQASARIS
ncbi:MAG TPA: TadE/TadG family type IV pilus assembly protein [Stellaceae bacterium]|nr:TadE/TadG family type IV pilus assembly protein [Stellaceae bacterium]